MPRVSRRNNTNSASNNLPAGLYRALSSAVTPLPTPREIQDPEKRHTSTTHIGSSHLALNSGNGNLHCYRRYLSHLEALSERDARNNSTCENSVNSSRRVHLLAFQTLMGNVLSKVPLVSQSSWIRSWSSWQYDLTDDYLARANAFLRRLLDIIQGDPRFFTRTSSTPDLCCAHCNAQLGDNTFVALITFESSSQQYLPRIARFCRNNTSCTSQLGNC